MKDHIKYFCEAQEGDADKMLKKKGEEEEEE